MKKASTSRLKKLPLLLGTLLIISVAAYGTRAYFSDSAKQQANIELALGDVEISASETDWTYDSEGNDLEESYKSNDTQRYISYTNVKPGDSFTRDYTIENTGTLDVDVELDYDGKYSDLIETKDGNLTFEDGPFVVTVIGFENATELTADSKIDYKVTIEVIEIVDNEFNVNDKAKAKALAEGNTLDSIVSEFLGETLTVNVNQKQKQNE